jgi:hypothetical protein
MESAGHSVPGPDDDQQPISDAAATSAPPSPTAGDTAAPPTRPPAVPPPITSPRPVQPYPAQPSGRAPGAGWWIGAFVVAAVLGVGGYLIGHNAGENAERDKYATGAPGYDTIYQQGVAAGKTQGTQQGQAQGAAAGEQVGFEQGEQQGTAQGEQQGESQGTAAGATAALGGFSAWEPGAPYIVKVQAGTNSVPYEIDSRTQLQPATEYALCKDDPTQVCTIQK